ncbi:MAG: 4Fe-4S single cluster domain-containing protein [Planctomycetaceae bacterium]
MDLDPTFLIVDSSPAEFGATELQVAEIQDYSYVAGPGRRCVVWLAGCRRRCPGCFQPQFFSFAVGRRYRVEELAERILAIQGIDGVTFSDGEPFEQSSALAELCRILKSRTDLSLLAYTGYQVEWLRGADDQYCDFLDTLDVVIDGEYRENEAGTYLWRGSRNQRIIFLKGEANPEALNASSTVQQEIQLTVTSSNVLLTGFPDERSSRDLEASLKKKGIITAPAKKVADDGEA